MRKRQYGKRKIVVAGEMLELGPDAESIHGETGVSIAAAGIDKLIGVRGMAERLVQAARSAGLQDSTFAPDSPAAGELLAGEIREGDIVLIKGSRGVRTEKVVEKLLEKFEFEAEESATR